jgi:hypothetical protein
LRDSMLCAPFHSRHAPLLCASLHR